MGKLKEIPGQKPDVVQLDQMRLVPEIVELPELVCFCEPTPTPSKPPVCPTTPKQPSSKLQPAQSSPLQVQRGGGQEGEPASNQRPPKQRSPKQSSPKRPKRRSSHASPGVTRKAQYPAASKAVKLVAISMRLIQDGVAPKLVDQHQGDEGALHRLDQGGEQAYLLTSASNPKPSNPARRPHSRLLAELGTRIKHCYLLGFR
eukprot:TRINITY_DN51404_c0_g1_i1.p1 TRINITY_DN51404_c0_g1~~TRINITY_DN51404_c0_g1_i1.p1  ORF type:complete len:202 (-),score=18.61 TRINITY_DN51404_c0_g1_i1:81-686(-)